MDAVMQPVVGASPEVFKPIFLFIYTKTLLIARKLQAGV